MKRKDGFFGEDFLIFDAHCDTANVLLDESSYFIEGDNSHLNEANIRKGGLKSQIFAIWVNQAYSPYRAIKQALLMYNALERKIFNMEYGEKVTSSSEMKNVIDRGKLACWLSLEGGHIIENSVRILEFFYSLGIRFMTITHFKNTDWADSSVDIPKWDGLNKLGRKIISKMDEIGMVIDVSHSSDKTVEDILEIVSMPIMASHSCSRTLCDIPRNIPDTLVKEIGVGGGFIGVNFFPGFLKKKISDQVNINIDKYKKDYQNKIEGNEGNPDLLNQADLWFFRKIVEGNDKTDLNSVIDHIKHIADVGGIDCVGLGSDFDGIPSTPVDLTDVSCYPSLIDGLFDRGFNDMEIRGIMGLNLFNFIKKFDK